MRLLYNTLVHKSYLFFFACNNTATYIIALTLLFNKWLHKFSLKVCIYIPFMFSRVLAGLWPLKATSLYVLYILAKKHERFLLHSYAFLLADVSVCLAWCVCCCVFSMLFNNTLGYIFAAAYQQSKLVMVTIVSYACQEWRFRRRRGQEKRISNTIITIYHINSITYQLLEL